MKTELLLLSLLALSGIYLFSEHSSSESLQSTQIFTDNENIEEFKAYQAWKAEYNQNFNSAEESYRFAQFRKSYRFINEHNAKGDQLVLGLNSFAAMPVEEFASIMLMRSRAEVTDVSNDVPKSENISVDWKAKGAVLPTANQGNCGSCWAFASIGSLQGLRYIVDGVLERLSAQQLVSCIPKSALDPGAENGCGGSEPQYAFEYTHKHGIETWAEYPYVSGDSGYVPACHHKDSDSVFFNKGDKPGDNGFVRIQRGDVADMKKRIQEQPYAVSVAASSIFFQLYEQGILKSTHCGNDLNHSILLYGLHDVEGEEPYWMVQNSWGPDRWGQGGYGKIAVTEGDGVCGINMENDVPLSVNQKPGV